MTSEAMELAALIQRAKEIAQAAAANLHDLPEAKSLPEIEQLLDGAIREASEAKKAIRKARRIAGV